MKDKPFYLDDGVYGEMVDPMTVRLWTERVTTKGGKGDFVTHEIYLERSVVKALVDIMGVNTEANARLIAAAPELFEALEALLNETKAGSWDCLPVEMAKNAIRKAKGK